MGRYSYSRRRSTRVPVGVTAIGGDEPLRLQSMTNTPTLDTEACVAQARRIAEAGADLVRLTAQGVTHARNLGNIRRELRAAGVDTPLVADIHFNAAAAFAAAEEVEKVRINPGNFVDPGRTFKKLTYTDEEYAAEIGRIREKLVPFLALCREHGTALRLGVNHGSLSDRIMSRYGDTPAGMVESAMEFLRICRSEDFNDIVISIKASNTQVMTATVRLLVKEMQEEGMDYPLHLGVTEAGDGEDGRIKSAAGIATLLAEGIGDTIRVSLSEAPEAEIPVARFLRDYITSREGHAPVIEPETVLPGLSRSHSFRMPGNSGNLPEPLVAGLDFAEIPASWHFTDASSLPRLLSDTLPVVLSSANANATGEIMSWIDRFQALGGKNPVLVSLRYDDSDSGNLAIKAAADFGTLLLNGYCSAISLDAPADTETIHRLELAILQAARLRFSKTEFIACPSCGRTLFDLPATLQEVKAAVGHLKDLKIGVMGCVVNGPGEMADADYGYVGAGRGRVSIYRGKDLIEKNIPREEALAALIALIKADGRWQAPR